MTDGTAGVLAWYLSGSRCRLAYGPADATATHCLLLQKKSRSVLPYWHRLTQVVPGKRAVKPVRACVCVCVSVHDSWPKIRIRDCNGTTISSQQKQNATGADVFGRRCRPGGRLQLESFNQLLFSFSYHCQVIHIQQFLWQGNPKSSKSPKSFLL